MVWARNILVRLLIAVTIVGAFTQVALANYSAAVNFTNRKDHVRAAAAYFQAMSFPKDRGQKYKAEFGLAESLYKIGFLYSASKYYSIIVRRGARGSANPFFQTALERLGRINSTISLGQSHIVQLFKAKISPSVVPGAARGFYFYYLGIEAFNRRQFEKAERYFKRVPSGSNYGLGAQFHLGVVANLRGRHSAAIGYFERVANATGRSSRFAEMREMAIMNIGRVEYERRRYRQAIGYYSQISDVSESWLDALWEASWAFFLMQKHNNALGNIHTIHSPFFINRFYPESYILQSITFLRLCRYDQVKKSLREFRTRYKPVFRDVNAMLKRYEGNSKGFFRLVYNYYFGSKAGYRYAWAILDKLSRTDTFKQANDTIKFSDREIARLSRFGSYWRSSGLEEELSRFLRSKKSAAQAGAGRRMFSQGASFYAYLKELSDQTGLIQLEMLEGKIDKLRCQINVGQAEKKVNFIGGMQELRLSQDLEYWPFEGEYWEDELGGYVYNIDSRCRKKCK